MMFLIAARVASAILFLLLIHFFIEEDMSDEAFGIMVILVIVLMLFPWCGVIPDDSMSFKVEGLNVP